MRPTLSAPRKESAHLRLRVAHRGRRRDDLRAHHFAIHYVRRERVEGRFVQAHHGSEGTADEVKLVLNDEVGREQRGREGGRADG